MSKVLIKTEYSWFDDIYFTSWEVWEKDLLEQAKKNIIQYFEEGGSDIPVQVGKNQTMYIENANDILGPWCFLTQHPISDSDAEVLNRIFSGTSGKIPFSKLYSELMKVWEKPENFGL